MCNARKTSNTASSTLPCFCLYIFYYITSLITTLKIKIFCRLTCVITPLLFCALILQPTHAASHKLTTKQSIIANFIAQGVEPLIADCAAHASFIVPMSQNYQKIEFEEGVLYPPGASIEIWNKAFDSKKQRIEVEKVVTLQGRAKEKHKKRPYLNLELRCGYVKNMLLAFDFFDPFIVSTKKNPN